MNTYIVRPKDGKKRWNRFLTMSQLLCGFIVLWWTPYRHVPHAGKAVGAVAVAAAAMSLHEGMKDWQKLLWILVIAAMLVTELRAIDKDRDNANGQAIQDRRVLDQQFQAVLGNEDKDFQKTSSDLKDSYIQSQKQFDATVGQIKGVLDTTHAVARLAEENLQTLTGGESFAYVYPDFSPGAPTIWKIHNDGDQMLTGVVVKIDRIPSGSFDPGMVGYLELQFATPIQAGVIPKKWGEVLPSPELWPRITTRPDGTAKYLIFISAQNDGDRELLELRPSPDGQSFDYRFDVFMSRSGPPRPGDYIKNGKIVRKVMSTKWNSPSIDPMPPELQ